MTSIWVVNGNDHRDSWGEMFATEQEAQAYVLRDAAARRKLEIAQGFDDPGYIAPAKYVEIQLDSILKPTLWEKYLYIYRKGEK